MGGDESVGVEPSPSCSTMAVRSAFVMRFRGVQPSEVPGFVTLMTTNGFQVFITVFGCTSTRQRMSSYDLIIEEMPVSVSTCKEREGV